MPPVVAAPCLRSAARPSPCSRSAITSKPASCPAARPSRCASRSRRAQEHPRGRRHLDRQDHPGQCAAGRSRQDRRPRSADRGYARAAMRRAHPRFTPHQGRRGLAFRSRALLATAAAGPHPIGEVRGAEALDLLKAWGTGHPGGVGTLHAGSAIGALRRLEQLIQEAVVTVPRALIAETIDVIAVLSGRGAARRPRRTRRRRGPRSRRRLRPHPAGEP